MTDSFTETLAARGFEHVDSRIAGSWHSDGDVTLCVSANRPASPNRYTVRVYEGSPRFVDVPTAELLATAHSDSGSRAVELALDSVDADDRRAE